MVYYSHFKKCLVIDQVNSFLIDSIIASRLRDYLPEYFEMLRLKKSIIKKSRFVHFSNKQSIESKETRIQQIYRMAMNRKGGQLEDLSINIDDSQKVFALVTKVKEIIKRLAVHLKDQELNGSSRIFWKNGRLFIELVLHLCNTTIAYHRLLQADQLPKKIIVTIIKFGDTLGFFVS